MKKRYMEPTVHVVHFQNGVFMTASSIESEAVDNEGNDGPQPESAEESVVPPNTILQHDPTPSATPEETGEATPEPSVTPDETTTPTPSATPEETEDPTPTPDPTPSPEVVEEVVPVQEVAVD